VVTNISAYQTGYGDATLEKADPKTAESLCDYLGNPLDYQLFEPFAFNPPESRWERFKWSLGLRNSLHEQVMQEYDKAIFLLENTLPTTILQLKNHFVAFCYLDGKIKAYQKAAAEGEKQLFERAGKCARIFYRFIRFVLSFFIPSSRLGIKTNPKDRSKRLYARIGGFEINKEEYDVIARVFFRKGGELDKSSFYMDGSVHVCIFPKSSPPSAQEMLKTQGDYPYICASIERRGLEDKNCIAEKHLYSKPLTNHDRILGISEMNCFDEGQGAIGSDRLLDQKLAQIMIEMAQQNDDIREIHTMANQDALPLLVAAGFWGSCGGPTHILDPKYILEQLKELKTFREQPTHKLFPPSRDYAVSKMRFSIKTINSRDVYFQKEWVPQSWPEKIAQGPILNEGAGKLPEYWIKKTNVPPLMEQLADCWRRTRNLTTLSDIHKQLFEEIVLLVERDEALNSKKIQQLEDCFHTHLISDLLAKTSVEILNIFRDFLYLPAETGAERGNTDGVTNRDRLSVARKKLAFMLIEDRNITAEDIKIHFHETMYVIIVEAVKNLSTIQVLSKEDPNQLINIPVSDEDRARIYQFLGVDPDRGPLGQSISNWKMFSKVAIPFFRKPSLVGIEIKQQAVFNHLFLLLHGRCKIDLKDKVII
jgi:hypothetical protein